MDKLGIAEIWAFCVTILVIGGLTNWDNLAMLTAAAVLGCILLFKLTLRFLAPKK